MTAKDKQKLKALHKKYGKTRYEFGTSHLREDEYFQTWTNSQENRLLSEPTINGLNINRSVFRK
jgi:hypothetical protein